jgi:hypothetical protein
MLSPGTLENGFVLAFPDRVAMRSAAVKIRKSGNRRTGPLSLWAVVVAGECRSTGPGGMI